MNFKRKIGFVGLMFTAIGGIVGSGWLFGPFYAAKIAGPSAILAWFIGGLLMIIIALTFAELATLFPVAGATVRFAQFSHGTFVSFTIAWISWLAAVIVAPIETMAILQYSANYFPALAISTQGFTHLTLFGISIAALIMLLMCILNMAGIQFFSKTNNVMVFWKLIIPFVTIIILLTQRFNVTNFIGHGGFMPYGIKGMLASLPTGGIIMSFIGFSGAIQLAAEAENPHHAIPFAIILAVAICIILYTLLETAFIGVLPTHSLADGWNHLTFSHDQGPIAGILTALGIVWFVKLLYVDAIISPFSTAYIYTTSTARINYGMSKNGYMPKIMQKLSHNDSPMAAMILNYIVGMIFFLPFPGWQSMVGFIVSCFVLSYAVGPIACLSLRYRYPDKPRSFRLPAARFICALAFYICTLIVYWTGWHTVWRMFLTVGVGYLFLPIYRKVCRHTVEPLELKRGYWLLPYFAGLALISYLSPFEGKNMIKFGWDFLIIAIFSLVIFYWAVKSRIVDEIS